MHLLVIKHFLQKSTATERKHANVVLVIEGFHFICTYLFTCKFKRNMKSSVSRNGKRSAVQPVIITNGIVRMK